MKMEVEKMELNVEDKDEDSSDKAVEELSTEYSQYLKIDSEKEYGKFNTTVEEMLTKLEEFGGFVDVIRSDSAICLNEAMPLIEKKCKEMDIVFDKIDRLEKFVLLVKDNISIMEGELVKAEDQMGSFSGLKKMLSSFVSPKRTQVKETKNVGYVVPEIFKTEDFLCKHSKEQDIKKHTDSKESSAVEDKNSKENSANIDKDSKENSAVGSCKDNVETPGSAMTDKDTNNKTEK